MVVKILIWYICVHLCGGISMSIRGGTIKKLWSYSRLDRKMTVEANTILIYFTSLSFIVDSEKDTFIFNLLFVKFVRSRVWVWVLLNTLNHLWLFNVIYESYLSYVMEKQIWERRLEIAKATHTKRIVSEGVGRDMVDTR